LGGSVLYPEQLEGRMIKGVIAMVIALSWCLPVSSFQTVHTAQPSIRFKKNKSPNTEQEHVCEEFSSSEFKRRWIAGVEVTRLSRPKQIGIT